MHLLIVEDDERLASLLRKGLRGEGHIVDHVPDGQEGLERALSDAYDAIILDLTLPGLDGLDVARRLRTQGSTTPVLMLTARNALHQRLEGFDAGADDFLAKPFAFAELLARLRAVTRRGAALEEDKLVVADLVLDRVSHLVTRGGRELTLAPREYALLEYLMRNPGRVRSRTMILDAYGTMATKRSPTWSTQPSLDCARKSIRVLTPLIQTVRGVGYLIKG